MLDLDVIAARQGRSVSDFLAECMHTAMREVDKNPGQTLQPDEYLIQDVQPGEYAVIVNG